MPLAETAPALLYLVSIRAPRCRGAMHRHAVSDCRSDLVSIRAPRCRGAMLFSDNDLILYVQTWQVREPRSNGAP
jgi:hypothetical protein